MEESGRRGRELELTCFELVNCAPKRSPVRQRADWVWQNKAHQLKMRKEFAETSSVVKRPAAVFMSLWPWHISGHCGHGFRSRRIVTWRSKTQVPSLCRVSQTNSTLYAVICEMKLQHTLDRNSEASSADSKSIRKEIYIICFYIRQMRFRSTPKYVNALPMKQNWDPLF